jgi:hypothetical protein
MLLGAVDDLRGKELFVALVPGLLHSQSDELHIKEPRTGHRSLPREQAIRYPQTLSAIRELISVSCKVFRPEFILEKIVDHFFPGFLVNAACNYHCVCPQFLVKGVQVRFSTFAAQQKILNFIKERWA